MKQNKIFIIGLPRTGTTSICVAMLKLGYRVAHTAYTDLAIQQAQVIADTPVFCDYQTLDKQYPGAKFIYLTRELSLWLPSIKQLLQRMYVNTTRTDGGFHPWLKRCYTTVFSPFTEQNIARDAFLTQCYQQHFNQASDYFIERSDDFLVIDVAQPESFTQLLKFLTIDPSTVTINGFERINIGGKITAWNNIKHPLKIAANLKPRDLA